jgi:hypothetical protein
MPVGAVDLALSLLYVALLILLVVVSLRVISRPDSRG